MAKQPITLKSLTNPTSEDLQFYWGGAEYVVKAGKQTQFVSDVAEHGAKKLADKNILTTDPDEHQVLSQAYLENSDPKVIAKKLGIDLDKIRKQAEDKKKGEARVTNLEAELVSQRETVKKLEAMVEKVVNSKAPKVQAEKASRSKKSK